MIPILYDTVTEGTVPSSFGVGCLTDTISASVTEARNGSYEMTLTYAENGIHAEDIQINRFIMAKPNFTDNPQLFRIYKVGKAMNGKFEVNAQHISYDLSGKIITSGTASSCSGACSLLQAKAGNFTINTDKTVSASFSITEPSSVRSWFGGKAGSLLDVFGTGEWKYDNYVCSLKVARGQDRGVQLRFGKNLTELSQTVDLSNLVTGIIPYYIDQDGNKTVGTKVNTGLVLDVPRDVAINFSQDVDPDSGTAITTQLATLANKYKNNNNLTVAFNSITLDFVQLQDLKERVDLCDTVHIYFEPLEITATAKCVSTTWDVLNERYTKTTFGDARTNIADTLSNTAKTLANVPTSSFMNTAIAHATDLITGNLGGYLRLNDSNGDGEPDELLIMDTADISTATKVWRWNKNGLGYSSTGYSGTYGTAITADGKIVADYIATGTLDASKISVSHLSGSSIDTGTLNADLIKAGTLNCSLITVSNLNASSITTGTLDGTKATITNINASNINAGTLNANLIKAGTISDTQGNSSINMTTGEAKLKNLKALENFYLLGTSNNTKALLQHMGTDGARFQLFDSSNHPLVDLWAHNGNGSIQLNNSSNAQIVSLGDAGLLLNNSSGNQRARLWITNNSGVLNLANTWGTETITCGGDSGNITCVSLTQTSSRKTKENIRPIEDSMKILDLEAVSFDYKNKDWGSNQRGFIAEDVAEVLPNLVTPETDTRPASLNYTGMIPYLQDVIKKQEERIKVLEEKITKLGG